MEGVVEVCRDIGNRHFVWFARLIENHIDGIVNHAGCQRESYMVVLTNGMIEGLHRDAYGCSDDKYFIRILEERGDTLPDRKWELHRGHPQFLS
jgi:hypothetical protein